MFTSDLTALSKLLEESAPPPAVATSAAARLTPSDLATGAGGRSASATATAAGSSAKPAGKDIWDGEEVHVEVADNRRRPTFDIVYGQRVGAEDVFLGISGKTPSTLDCDTMVMKIQLPGCTLAEIELDVKPDRITVATKSFRLATALPHRVKDKDGKAAWDGDRCLLSVTLPIDRDDWMA